MTLFSFVNDIVMTVTLLAVLLNRTFKGCYQRYLSVKVLINIQGMTPEIDFTRNI